MKSNRVRRTSMCCAFVIVSLGVQLTAQGTPDFSGSWILESGSAGADTPQMLSVRQSLVRTNVRGEPMKPFFRDITITRSLPSGTRTETYQIGVVGGTVSGRADGSVDRPRNHYRVAWEEQALVIESGSFAGPVPEIGEWAEWREVWSLDSGAQLHVAITTRRSVDDAPTTSMLVYRRR